MSHPAETIIDRIAELLRDHETITAVSADNVYSHRSLPLADVANAAHDQVPAICVNAGEDEPVTEYQGEDGHSTIQSRLTVDVMLFERANDEPTLKHKLFDMRSGVQSVVLADFKLGLSFVLSTSYGGAGRPDFDSSTNRIAGGYIMRFQVLYQMSSVIS
jgi:hypothetical protein